jgi:uncharacterized protein YjiS (DUF1127 family)
MLSTTDDRIKNIGDFRPPDDGGRARDLVSRPHDPLGSSSGPSVSAKRTAKIYPFVKAAAHDHDHTHREPTWIVRIWWERWLERRRFARALPWLADEVLEDYGLTREEARRLCRRPFWLK